MTVIELFQFSAFLVDAASGTRQAPNELQGVDITFKKQKFGTDTPRVPTSVKFNRCIGTAPESDESFKAYEVTLHEIGHALGLAGFDYLNFVLVQRQSYHKAHPTIPDTVMNYDNETKSDWFDWGPSIEEEPDCSPHPFDILAINSLYQQVP